MPPYNLTDESVSQSEHSPDIVKNEEVLLRLGFHPQHIIDNQLIPSAIATDDLLERGFSVDRQAYASIDTLEILAVTQRARAPELRQQAYVSTFSCLKVRQITCSPDGCEDRAFIVIDKALEENKAHAAIYSTRSGRGEVKKLKSKLLPLLNNNLLTLDVYRQQLSFA